MSEETILKNICEHCSKQHDESFEQESKKFCCEQCCDEWKTKGKPTEKKPQICEFC